MITRHRINIRFLVHKRVRATWTVDAFKEEGRTIAVRCYQFSVHGSERRLQDGWLARDEANIAAKREEITKIMKDPNVRTEREEASDLDGGRPILSLHDIKL